MKKIKFPFVSRKKYEILVENIKVTNNARAALANVFKEVQEENVKLGIEIERLNEEIKDKKKEISNLKRLLTKNKISYKKEEK